MAACFHDGFLATGHSRASSIYIGSNITASLSGLFTRVE
jgi:hypothetical protein